jgi:hypothetical protein
MGICGTGPKDYLSILEDEGQGLGPDLVLVSFFMGNDFTSPTVAPAATGWISRSYLATFLSFLVNVKTKLRGEVFVGASAPAHTYDDNRPMFTDDFYLELENERSSIYWKRDSNFNRQSAEAVGYLLAMKRLCDARGIALIVVGIPDEIQANPSLRARVLRLRASAGGPAEFDFTLPNRVLAERLHAAGLRYVDLLDGFAAAAAQTTLYKPIDTHWNIAGNRLASLILQRELSPLISQPSSKSHP